MTVRRMVQLVTQHADGSLSTTGWHVTGDPHDTLAALYGAPAYHRHIDAATRERVRPAVTGIGVTIHPHTD